MLFLSAPRQSVMAPHYSRGGHLTDEKFSGVIADVLRVSFWIAKHIFLFPRMNKMRPPSLLTTSLYGRFCSSCRTRFCNTNNFSCQNLLERESGITPFFLPLSHILLKSYLLTIRPKQNPKNSPRPSYLLDQKNDIMKIKTVLRLCEPLPRGTEVCA